jgi:hypothetical protein
VSRLLLEEHPVRWVTSAALWTSALAAGADSSTAQRSAMRRPALLRYDSDSFMEDLARELETDPDLVAAHEAHAHSFRNRPPGVAEDWEPPGTAPKLKLYQPSHGHFNLVAASLVCQIPGLPDRAVQPAAGDKVSFVLRRLNGASELAWVEDPVANAGRAWRAIADAARATVAPTEELLPLFPTIFIADGRVRRQHVGLIPTSSRESYGNAGPASMPVAPDEGLDPRLIVLATSIRDPIRALQAQIAKEIAGNVPTEARVDPEILSPLLAMELAAFLADNLPGWRAILDSGTPPASGTNQWTVFTWLNTHSADGSRGLSWFQAVRGAWQDRLALCGEVGEPTFKLNLTTADTGFTAVVRQAWEAQVPVPPGSPSVPAVDGAPVAKLAALDARYVVRCVFQRPQCGPLHDDLVGERSADFAIASFFDLDAPQRTIQISLPIATDPASLRKARKNVTVLLSDQLKQQLSRVSELKDMSDGKLKDPEGLDIGLVCSLSIPIITICALFVLFIFISLLNIVFWWVPFFRICLPLGLKAKS